MLTAVRFAAQAEALGLIEEGTDFGAPPITDLPSTTVRLHGAGGPRSVRIYAFGHQFDSNLSPTQGKARRELSVVIDRALALPGDGASALYRPSQVRVLGWDHAKDGDGVPETGGGCPAAGHERVSAVTEPCRFGG